MRQLHTRLLSAVALAALATSTAAAPVYRCKQPDGSTALSDKECPAAGARRAGNEWVDVDLDRDARSVAEQNRILARRDALKRQEAENDRIAAEALARARRADDPRGRLLHRSTTYATLIGRGIACGWESKPATVRLNDWIEDQTRDNSSLRRELREAAAAALLVSSAQQRSGLTPDSCSSVLRNVSTLPPP